jgi:hypothetical protein
MANPSPQAALQIIGEEEEKAGVVDDQRVERHRRDTIRGK